MGKNKGAITIRKFSVSLIFLAAFILHVEVVVGADLRPVNVNQKIAVLKRKLTILRTMIKKAQAKKINMSRQKVSETVAELFIKYIPEDAKRKLGDYPANMSDFHILGKKEATKRINELPAFEIDTTEKVLDRAIAETRHMLKKPHSQLRFPSGKVSKIYIKNGAFHSGQSPVFLSGLHSYYSATPKDNYLNALKTLGANFIGPRNIVCRYDWIGENKFNDAHIEWQITQLNTYAKNGLYGSTMIGIYQPPKWLIKIAPDIDVKSKAFFDPEKAIRNKAKGWFRTAMDIDHPRTKNFYKTWFKRIASKLKGVPNNLSYSLMGEEWCMPSFRSKYTRSRYEKWLKKKYGNIKKLHKAWKTQYKTFYDATAIASVNNKGGHYDWYTFNEYRLTTLNQWQIDAIQEVDPKAYISCWPTAGCLINSPLVKTDTMVGRDREDIIRQSVGIVSWDGGIFSQEAGPSTMKLPESHWNKYTVGWRDEIIYYDFAKSLCPEKPIFAPELHSITSTHSLSPFGVPGNYMRTSLWLQHLHGLGAHLIWKDHGRQLNGTPVFDEFLGSLFTQPQLLESWGRTVLELRRLTKYIVLFPQLERKVKIFYSEPSAIQDNKNFPNKLLSIYEALYFLDYQVGFTTEKTIMKQGFQDCALLIIPDAKYVNKNVVKRIRQYRKRGGKIAILGQESLKYDEYGNVRDISDFLKDESLYLTGTTAEEYSPQLDSLMKRVGIKRPVRAFDIKGANAWGVEMRVADSAKGRIIYLINLKKENAEITLKMKNKQEKAIDLIHNKWIDISKPFVVKPRTPKLLKLKL